MPQQCHFLFVKHFRSLSNFNPNFFQKIPLIHSQFLNDTKPLSPKTQLFHSLSSPNYPNPNPNPNFSPIEFDKFSQFLKKSDLSLSPNLNRALDEVNSEPNLSLLVEIFKRVDLSPKIAFSLFKWAENRCGYDVTAPIFNSMIRMLAKSGEFKWALMVLFDKIKRVDGSDDLVLGESLEILIKYYARFGMILQAINVFELGNCLEFDLFEVLLAALCNNGHVRVASEFVDRRMSSDSDWVPSIEVYNMHFDGWFRVRDVERVERLWLRMRNDNLVPDVETYGILVRGYCRLGLVDRATELLREMRRNGVRLDGKVYGPIVQALARAGRFKEALGMLERCLVLEPGLSLLTYNCLVKEFCKAGDIDAAGKILKMMTSRGVLPTSMTYNFVFEYFARHGKVEEGVNLYRTMIHSGYTPDECAIHLILKMLFEEGNLELAMEISKEMRSGGTDLNVDATTMLIKLLCKAQRLKEAFEEFERLIQRGFVPKFPTYVSLHNELKNKRLHDMAIKTSQLMESVSSSGTLPNTVEQLAEIRRHRRKIIMGRATEISDKLKTYSDPEQLAKHRGCRKSDSASENPNKND